MNKTLKNVHCTLCDASIKNYTPTFNHLLIDNTHSIDVCDNCINTFMTWRQKILAQLFPTKVMKKLAQK